MKRKYLFLILLLFCLLISPVLSIDVHWNSLTGDTFTYSTWSNKMITSMEYLKLGNTTDSLIRMQGIMHGINNNASKSFSGRFSAYVYGYTTIEHKLSEGSYTIVFSNNLGEGSVIYYDYIFDTWYVPIDIYGNISYFSVFLDNPWAADEVLVNYTSLGVLNGLQQDYYGMYGIADYFGVDAIVSWVKNYTPPIVDFTYTNIPNPLTVTFTDATNFIPIENYWDFGDGYIYSTGDFNSPIQHTYASQGSYNVKYAAWDINLVHFGWMNKTINLFGITNATYSLSVTPETINYGNNFTLTLSAQGGNYAGIKELKYGWSKGVDTDILYDKDNSAYILDYSLIGGIWYQYDTVSGTFSINKGSAIPNPVYSIGNFGVGTYTINGYLIKTNNEVIHISDTLIITGENQQALTIEAQDYENGYLISGAHINVLNLASGIWDNRTGGTGAQLFYYPYNQKIWVEVTKSGYMDTTRNHTVRAIPADRLYLLLYRGQTPPVTNVSLSISVLDYNGLDFIPNAKIQLIPSNEVKYTGASGIATFLVLENTTYQILVSKTGYQPATYILLTFAGGQSQTLIVILTKSVTLTPTLPTSIPTIPPAAGLGGNITPAACQLQLPKGSTLLDSLKNNMACAGISSGQNQGFGIALMIIFALGVIGGKYGKGMGVVMGMSSGYVLSLAMGLVPVWTFIAMIIFICLILAVKIWSAP